MSCDERVPEAHCCASCHEDKDEYGYPMICLDDWREVCCTTYHALWKAGLSK